MSYRRSCLAGLLYRLLCGTQCLASVWKPFISPRRFFLGLFTHPVQDSERKQFRQELEKMLGVSKFEGGVMERS